MEQGDDVRGGPRPSRLPVDEARRWLRDARSVCVLTGAGVSAESGVPTFRGDDGLWRNYRFEDLATPEAFQRQPQVVWEWYDWRRQRISEARPNPAHDALARLEASKPGSTLVTQNVDGLHERAGCRNVVRLHGDIWQLRCTSCPREWRDERAPLPALPPRCDCGGLARPGVVWFGERLPAPAWRAAETAAATSDLLLVVGTSALVYPAAGLVPTAKSAGARVVEVNVEATPLSSFVDCALRGRAGEVLPVLVG